MAYFILKFAGIVAIISVVIYAVKAYIDNDK